MHKCLTLGNMQESACNSIECDTKLYKRVNLACILRHRTPYFVVCRQFHDSLLT